LRANSKPFGRLPASAREQAQAEVERLERFLRAVATTSSSERFAEDAP